MELHIHLKFTLRTQEFKEKEEMIVISHANDLPKIRSDRVPFDKLDFNTIL